MEKQNLENNQAPICLVTELRKEFVRRSKLNAAYSMRAYAQFLGVDQSLLSKVMNGKRQLSQSLIEKISPKLKIKPSQISKIIQSHFSEESLNYQTLADDEVSLLAEWSHFAILELIKTRNFQFDYDWMARRLKIHKEEVRDAVARLVRMGFVAIERETNKAENRIKLLKPNNHWNNTTSTTVARQELQRAILKQSQEALEVVDFSLREHGSLTVAIRKDRLPEFKEKLKKVRDELDAFFQPVADESQFDEVYQLSLSFFPITEIEKFKNKK